jgi:hypothetical protein
VTPEHPIYSRERDRYIPAGNLSAGDTLETLQGCCVRLVGIETLRSPPTGVFNLEVMGAHNYFVRALSTGDGLLVHNAYFGKALPHLFGKHGKQWGAVSVRQFMGVIRGHMDSATDIVAGTYRGVERGIHYFNKQTKMWVFEDLYGEIKYAWKLDARQVWGLFNKANVQ